MRLEPYEGKLSSTVLRGGSGSNATSLPDPLANPNPPTSLTVQLLRDRTDVIPDVVKVDWVKDAVSPGTGIEILVTDYLGKRHSVYASNGP